MVSHNTNLVNYLIGGTFTNTCVHVALAGRARPRVGPPAMRPQITFVNMTYQ